MDTAEIDWDDVRYFLAVARQGSVRAAADRLGVNHTTVLRRIAQLEARLGSQMFERLPTGYRLTEAGEQVLGLAEEMEASSHALVTRVFGRDQAVRGLLRVTMAPTIASHLLMPDFADFAAAYPEIEIEILSSQGKVNLTNREADVALRVVFDRDALPQNLHGVKGPDLSIGLYASAAVLAAGESRPRWITRFGEGPPDWAGAAIRFADVPLRIAEEAAHIEALRLGMGVSMLPCFVGDTEPRLARVPGSGLGPHGCLWILTQGETRKTRRVRLFTEFIAARLRGHAAVLAGEGAPPRP